MTAVAFLTLGRSETAARLFPALFGVLGTFMLSDLGQRLIGRRAGLLAAMVWASGYFVIGEYRKSMADPYLAFFVLVCFWSWVRFASESQGGGSLRRGGAWLGLFYISLGLAMLAKGPVALVHVLIAVAAYQYCFGRRWPRGGWVHLLGIAMAVIIAGGWPLLVLRQVPGALELWRYESVGELYDNVEHARPWWFYLPGIFELSMPWTPFLLAGLIAPFLHGRRRPRGDALFPIIWFFGVLIFFSFVNLKKNAYLLPAMPAMVLVIGRGFLATIALA
jgi:4-amino-4-deoxy-L-arabinose transferase-like glycosyltransferase